MYRKLGRTNKHRRSMLANLTKDVIMNEKITTTETRAKEARKFALAFLQNDTEAVKKVFDVLAPRYAKRNGGYTRIIKLDERRGDDALMVILELVEEDAK